VTSPTRCFSVEIIASTSVAAALKRAGLKKGFKRKGREYRLRVVDMPGQPNPNGVLHRADLRVLVLDSMQWLPRNFVAAMLTGDLRPQKPPIQRLLVIGWLPWDKGGGTIRGSIRAQPCLQLLFEAFEPRYLRLPLCQSQIRAAIAQALSDKEAETCWRRDWQRVKVALEGLRAQLPGSPSAQDNWFSLDRLAATGPSERLMAEHEIMRANSDAGRFMAIWEYQTKLDHYYLASCRPPLQDGPRRFLIIDDHPDRIRDKLSALTKATGDEFLIARDWRGCLEKLKPGARKLRLPGDCQRIGPTDSKQEKCKMPSFRELDGILVDLLFEGAVSGLTAIRVLSERHPEIPAFLMTWSEEPDVMAQAVRESNACGFVSKRRLFRLPYEVDRFLFGEISPLLPHLGPVLGRRLVGLIRLWKSCPGTLWHGEKTFHAAEHAIEHHTSLWRLANTLLARTWDDIRRKGCTASDLFRFFVSLWLHDIGCKGDAEYQYAPVVRKYHAPLSGRLIRSKPELYDLRRSESDHVALLCEYHQSGTPFVKMSDAKRRMQSFFPRGALYEVAPHLAPWAALLRILDQIDNHWKRVGGESVYRSKCETLRNDQAFYARRSHGYAGWLQEQETLHLPKHRAISGVTICVARAPDDAVGHDGHPVQWHFWPGYAYESKHAARQWHYGDDGVALYVLDEWAVTGRFVECLGLCLPKDPPPSHVGQDVEWVWNDRTHFMR